MAGDKQDRGRVVELAGNSAKAAKRGRGRGRPFRPGQSGNPAGRPKDAGVRELARQHTETAIAVLAQIATNPQARDADRIAAAQALLDRGYGRPTTYVEQELSGPGGAPMTVTVAELMEMADRVDPR